MFDKKILGVREGIRVLVVAQQDSLDKIAKKIDAFEGMERLALIANHYSFEVLERHTKFEVYQEYLTAIDNRLKAQSAEEAYKGLLMRLRRDMATRIAGSLSQSTSPKANFESAARNSALAEVLCVFNDWDLADAE